MNSFYLFYLIIMIVVVASLIVKDGPLTYELDAVIEKYDQKYGIFKIVKLAKNVGLGIALNYGIEQCTHELIARTDADDIATPDRFEKQIRYIVQFPEVVMVGANIIEYDLAIGGDMHNIQDSLVRVRGGSTMIARRGGFRYAMHSFKFLLKAYRLGSIGTLDLIKNMCVRIPISIAPSSIRGIIYNKSLRQKE